MKRAPAKPALGTALLLAVSIALSTAAVMAGCSEPEPPSAPEPKQALASSAETAAPPNVVVITLDTTRADALGAYGQSYPSSPEIDRMASQGVLFEQCVSSAPSTLPSHASIFTGKHPYAHGARSNGGYVLSQQNLTLAERLREHGYETAAEVATGVIEARTQLDQGFDHYRGPSDPGVELKQIQFRDGDEVRNVVQSDRTAADITRRGIEFLRAKRSRPFFLWLHYFDPHSPYSAPGLFNQRIPESPYHAEVAYTDMQIGLLLRELRRLAMKERTLVVLTADHGEGMRDHGEHTHSFFVYETTMRVPLIFWGPESLLESWRVSSLVRTIDIAPTVLDFLGLPPLPDVQGTSLLPLLTGEAQDLGLTGYGESIEFASTFGGDVLRFVREGNWKYIHTPRPALYDLSSDPGEQRNLAEREPEVAARLRARLEQLLADAPAKPRDAAQAVDAETRAELIALGYVGADAPATTLEARESIELRSFDPVSKTKDVALFSGTRGRLEMGHCDRAIHGLEELWERNPQSAPVLGFMVQCLLDLERNEDAVPLITRASELAPNNAPLFVDLARMAQRAGHIPEAITAIQSAVAIDPCSAAPRATLGELLRLEGRHAERFEVLETGVSQCPDTAEFRNDLAWALATSSQAELRDGARAVSLAQAAVAASADNVGYLDTLAAAYAEAGDFETAVRTAQRVIELLEARSVPDAAQAVFREHLALFEAGQPVHDS